MIFFLRPYIIIICVVVARERLNPNHTIVILYTYIFIIYINMYIIGIYVYNTYTYTYICIRIDVYNIFHVEIYCDIPMYTRTSVLSDYPRSKIRIALSRVSSIGHDKRLRMSEWVKPRKKFVLILHPGYFCCGSRRLEIISVRSVMVTIHYNIPKTYIITIIWYLCQHKL